MDLASLAVFAAALFVAASTPGPTVTAIVARVLGRGTTGAIAFISGAAIGDVVWLTLAVSGLAVLAQTFHQVFVAVKWAGVAYLCTIAWKMWTAPVAALEVAPETSRESPLSLFLGALAISLGNPKVMVFYVALTPTIVDVARLTLPGYAGLVAATLSVLGIVFGSYVLLASRARLLFSSPRAMRAVNRGAALTIAGAATWVAVR